MVFAVMMAALVAGCSAKYHVSVNGFLDVTRAQAVAPAARIFMVEEDQKNNPLFQDEVKQKIHGLLLSRGYTTVQAESADYQLLFRYGMDSGQTVEGTRLVHEPSQIVMVHRSNNRGGQSYSTIHMPGATYRVPYSETIFGHWLTLYLYDAAPTEDVSIPNKPIWIGEISCHVSSSDLREIINPMLVAAFEHFGQNTHKLIRETIKTTDPRVRQLNGD